MPGNTDIEGKNITDCASVAVGNKIYFRTNVFLKNKTNSSQKKKIMYT